MVSEVTHAFELERAVEHADLAQVQVALELDRLGQSVTPSESRNAQNDGWDALWCAPQRATDLEASLTLERRLLLLLLRSPSAQTAGAAERALLLLLLAAVAVAAAGLGRRQPDAIGADACHQPTSQEAD